MNYLTIRNQVADEIALQESMGYEIGERPLPPLPEGFTTAGEHDRIYIPRVDDRYLTHTITIGSPRELAQVFEAAEELGGGQYLGKNTVVRHEEQHANAATLMGQATVRYLARLQVSPAFIHGDRSVRPIGILPSVILEDVHVSLLGMGLFLASPEDSTNSPEDTKRIKSLGYKDADEVIRRARLYNDTSSSNTYPIPRST